MLFYPPILSLNLINKSGACCQFFKGIPYLAHDLTLRHFVGSLDPNDLRFDLFVDYALLKFTLGFTGTKDQDSICLTELGNDLIIKFVESFGKFVIQLVFTLLVLGIER